MGLFDTFKRTNHIVLGSINDDIVYSFDSAKKQISKAPLVTFIKIIFSF